jgi:MarR family transcriptional regulator, organic hydroperoxide resistance regulator
MLQMQELSMGNFHEKHLRHVALRNRGGADEAQMYRLTDSFPYLLTRAGVRMGEMFSEELAGIGMTLPMYRVMAALWERDGQKLSELADMISIEMSTLSRLITEMKKRDLVSRQRQDGDERSVRLSLTAEGRVLVASLIPRAQSYEARAVQGFSAEQVAQMKRMFRTILKNLSAGSQMADDPSAGEGVAARPPMRRSA